MATPMAVICEMLFTLVDVTDLPLSGPVDPTAFDPEVFPADARDLAVALAEKVRRQPLVMHAPSDWVLHTRAVCGSRTRNQT
jgi:hypothetical protein